MSTIYCAKMQSRNSKRIQIQIYLQHLVFLDLLSSVYLSIRVEEDDDEMIHNSACVFSRLLVMLMSRHREKS